LAKPNVFLTPFEVTFTFWSKLVWLLWASSEIQIMFVLSLTMLYLTRLLMKSEHFESPTIVFITDRTDLDDQLSGQLTNAKSFIGDAKVALGSESCRYLAKPNVFLTPFEVTFTFWSKLVWLLWASSEIQITLVLSLSSSVSCEGTEKAVLTLGQRGAVKVLLCSTLLAY
jgi:hypothetical protein